MFEEKFGGILGSNVTFDGVSIFIGRKEIKLENIVNVFYSEPTMFSSGYVYFSQTGEPPKGEKSINLFGFKYPKKQENRVSELLEVLSSFQEEKNFNIIISEDGLGSIRMNDVAEIQEAKKQRKAEKQLLKCPKCKSTNLQHAGNKRKSFSVGKAVGGAVLTGGVGTLAGFAGKKGKKENFVCMNCGKKFER